MSKKYNTNPVYNSFIQSKEWRDIRENLFKIRGKKCEMCGSVDEIHVHHITYERFGGDELPEDLCVLCKDCHMEIHGISGKKKPNGKKGLPYYRRLAIQNMGIKKKGGKGWVSLAKLIVESRGLRPMFNGKVYARKYVISALKEFDK